jgi:hypothetical protein
MGESVTTFSRSLLYCAIALAAMMVLMGILRRVSLKSRVAKTIDHPKNRSMLIAKTHFLKKMGKRVLLIYTILITAAIACVIATGHGVEQIGFIALELFTCLLIAEDICYREKLLTLLQEYSLTATDDPREK